MRRPRKRVRAGADDGRAQYACAPIGSDDETAEGHLGRHSGIKTGRDDPCAAGAAGRGIVRRQDEVMDAGGVRCFREDNFQFAGRGSEGSGLLGRLALLDAGAFAGAAGHRAAVGGAGCGLPQGGQASLQLGKLDDQAQKKGDDGFDYHCGRSVTDEAIFPNEFTLGSMIAGPKREADLTGGGEMGYMGDLWQSPERSRMCG